MSRNVGQLIKSLKEELEQVEIDLNIIRAPEVEDADDYGSEDTHKHAKAERDVKVKVVGLNLEMIEHSLNSFNETTSKIYKDLLHSAIDDLFDLP